MKELTILLGGPQGAGLDSSAQILTSAFAYSGYGVISEREYFSNIKGKHSYINLRVSSSKFPLALTYPIQIIGAIDAETIFTHFNDLDEQGYLIYNEMVLNEYLEDIPSIDPPLKQRLIKSLKELNLDGSVSSLVKYLKNDKDVNLVALNYSSILAEAAKKFKLSASQAARYISAIIVGAIAGLLKINEENLVFGLKRLFADKQYLIEQNTFISRYTVETVKKQYKLIDFDSPKINKNELMIISGNDAVAMGKIIGGLRFQSYYPITPAADESFFIETFEKIKVNNKHLGLIIVFQAEDEIAAIASTIGAALTGVRSATATSGPGFSLMVEGLGWAGMNETPIVITYYQRGGPSTGQPTRGSQSDLLSALFASHGEFPKIILASGDHTEAFYDAIEAFNLAEKYQTPVIHLLDKFLANTIATIDVPKISSIKIDRGKLSLKNEKYKRFNASELISPRAFLGETVMWYGGEEKDEYGHTVEDSINRKVMYEKRMKKLELADEEIPYEKRAIYYGSEEAEFMLVGWGYVKGVALEAIEELSKKEFKGAYLHLRMFSPFPSNYIELIMKKFNGVKILIEHNYSAQAGKLIKLNTGISIENRIVKYTGRPMYTHEVIQAVEKVLKGENRVVLSYGA
ncbi:MAG: 2-oxoacid:ferredoxin oxidoreductase subunit alpha [Candidatus Bathyarchaeia archaeon]